MQSFVGKLTHACPVYYCSRSARPRALPAGLSVVAADWPHVSNSGYDGSSGLQHHDLGVGVGFGFRHEGSPRRLRRTSRRPRIAPPSSAGSTSIFMRIHVITSQRTSAENQKVCSHVSPGRNSGDESSPTTSW